MTDLFEKYGYAIDELKINKGRREIELTIRFRIHESDAFYTNFQRDAESYLPCMNIYNKEDILRYTNKDFSPSDKERSLYLDAINSGPNKVLISLLNGNTNFEIAAVLLGTKDISGDQSLLQYNYNKPFHYEGGVFTYTDFVENNPAVRELIKTLRNLKRYKHNPVKRTHTTDLWCTLRALDLFWS